MKLAWGFQLHVWNLPTMHRQFDITHWICVPSDRFPLGNKRKHTTSKEKIKNESGISVVQSLKILRILVLPRHGNHGTFNNH